MTEFGGRKWDLPSSERAGLWHGEDVEGGNYKLIEFNGLWVD